MQVSVTEAQRQLTELVRRAEAGDEVILTRHGHPCVRLVPIMVAPDRKTRPGAARNNYGICRVAGNAWTGCRAQPGFPLWR